MRKFLVPLLAIGALAVPSAAQAGHDRDGDSAVTLPTTVTTESEANAFARAYVQRNAGRIANLDLRDQRDSRGRDTRRSTVTDITTACLQHPVIAARFGCIVRFNAEVRDNSGPVYNSRSSRGGNDNNWDWDHRDVRRDRVRSVGCLAALRINGGPRFTPSVSVAFADCVSRLRARS